MATEVIDDLHVYLPRALKQAFKEHCADVDRSMNKQLVRLIKQWVSSR